jgi:hypothetical protein
VSPDRATRWPSWVRLLIGVFALIGLAYTALIAFVTFGNVCTVEESAIVPSPSDALVARVVVRSCGKQAPKTEVDLSRNVGTRGTISDVVLSANGQLVEGGRYARIPIHVVWRGEGELEISYPSGLASTSRHDTVDGVKISYKEISPP